MPNKEWLLIDCPCCTSTLLINTIDGSFENLGIKEAEEESESEPVVDSAMSDSDALGDALSDSEALGEDLLEVPADYQPVATEDRVNRADVSGITYIGGQEYIADDGRHLKVSHPRSGNKSGIRSETVLTAPNPKAKNAGKKHGMVAEMQAPGNATYHKPKRINPTGAVTNPEMTFEGDDPSQDYTGLTGQEAHFDNLLQEAYESDLADYGFHDSQF